MNNADQVFAEFSRSMGAEAPGLGQTDCIHFDIADVGELLLEKASPSGVGVHGHTSWVLVTLIRNLRSTSLPILRRALTLCHHRERLPLPVHCGLRGESRLAFIVRFKETELNLPELNQAVELLMDLQRRVET